MPVTPSALPLSVRQWPIAKHAHRYCDPLFEFRARERKR
jgi:hypothetical protein